MREAPQSGRAIPLLGADCFVRALDGMMSRSEQGPLIGQTVLEFEGAPDIDRFRDAVARLVMRYPILHARVGSDIFLRPVWKPQHRRNASRLPLHMWCLEDRPVTGDPSIQVADSLAGLQDRLLNTPLAGPGEHWNIRFDLLLNDSAAPLLLFTWAHLLFDGKGAESLLELLALDLPESPADSDVCKPRRSAGKNLEILRHTRRMIVHFTAISQVGFSSPSGPGARSGRLRHLVYTFDETATGAIRQRSARLVGPLFNLPFYLASSARAIDRIFFDRGQKPPQLVVSVPAHVRKKGGIATPFHNRLTMLFFRLTPADLSTLASACGAAAKQFLEMSKAKLDHSFSIALDLLRPLPPKAYMSFVLWHGRGEIVSFFHSHTGNFALGTSSFFGGTIRNAYHIPSVSTPPGIGVFFGEFRDKLTLTISWRQGCVTSDEVNALRESLLRDLTGTGEDT